MTPPPQRSTRRETIRDLCPPGGVIIDVGADHGHVSHAVGAIATERMPHRRGRSDVPWVIADGLAPFRTVDTAIVTGMGAYTIAHVLASGPTPTTAIVHAPDDPGTLRTWLAGHGWCIDAERLAPEGRRWAEVIRARRGHETATGLRLEFGPQLLDGRDPHLRAHLEHTLKRWEDIAAHTRETAPTRYARASARIGFLRGVLREHGWIDRPP